MSTLLSKLEYQCKNCESCDLYKTRSNIVFSSGNVSSAKIVLVGEAPGEKEDNEGKPFVGAAGKRLDKYLALSGLSRDNDLYIANMVKCRPPKNRVPTKDEKLACRHFLIEQILAINPKLILLCGATAMDGFLNVGKITEIHGKIFDVIVGQKTYKAMPILHPSPLCRFPDKENIMVQDLSKVKMLIF